MLNPKHYPNSKPQIQNLIPNANLKNLIVPLIGKVPPHPVESANSLISREFWPDGPIAPPQFPNRYKLRRVKAGPFANFLQISPA
jgi:hypothetical protein